MVALSIVGLNYDVTQAGSDVHTGRVVWCYVGSGPRKRITAAVVLTAVGSGGF